MKSLKYILIIIILFSVIGLIIYLNFNKNSQNNTFGKDDYSAKYMQANISDNNNNNSNNSDNTNSNDNNVFSNSLIYDFSQTNQQIEKELSTFSTEIKDDSEGRLTNIRLTCDILNDTVIDSGQTFSFNDIVGKPTSDKGYKKATVIIDGEHEQGIGGRKLSGK